MSRFPGASLAALGLVMLWGGAALADQGAEAFARKDFASAERLWRAEAAEGSAEAMQGLGLLYDLGLGVARDTAAALRWYLEAADLGLPEAQFNVGVMLDSGAAGPRAPTAAALWYSRAAAAGHQRGRYNLGLLYEAGDGVPQNPDLARYWFAAAGELAAARERLQPGPPPEVERGMRPPVPLGGTRVGATAQLAWSAAPGPPDSRFLVEIVGLGPLRALRVEETEASALSLTLGRDVGAWGWRVSRLDRAGGRYAASPWQMAGETGQRAPQGRLRIEAGPEDAAAQALARDLGNVFATAGFLVTEARAAPPEATSVTFAYAQEADLAGAVAAFLPALSAEAARQAADPAALPGDLVIRLRGGPSPPG